MQLRLGIFGGTFNPVHMGHLVMAQDALEEFELDRVLFVPSAMPPHKQGGSLVAASHRCAMLEAALTGDTRFEVSTVELERPEISYSIDTVSELQRRHPNARLFFIIGSDSLFELHTWRDIYRLLELCAFIVMGRPEFVGREINAETVRLETPWPERLSQNLTVAHLVGISASDIRMRVAEGLSIRYLVSEEVAMYISEHNLYRT